MPKVRQFTNIDGMSDADLDYIKKRLETRAVRIRITDRKSVGEERYFLINVDFGYSEKSIKKQHGGVELSFIWIGKNLWQFRYLNIQCTHTSRWKPPLEWLNYLLKLPKNR